MVNEILPNEVTMNINKCILTWINEKNFDTQYIIYILNHIKKTQSKLNSVYGVIYYLSNTSFINDYSSMLKYEECKKISNNKFDTDKKETEFTYKSNNGMDWCDVL